MRRVQFQGTFECLPGGGRIRPQLMHQPKVEVQVGPGRIDLDGVTQIGVRTAQVAILRAQTRAGVE
jgi:hypothetical protein